MKKNEHFVFDTNVIISAFLFPDSVLGRALDKVIWSGKLIASRDTIAELTKVFMKKKFEKYLPILVRQFLMAKYEKGILIFSVNEKVAICRDPDDNKFLALAKSAKASVIVSGDPDLLALSSFENIPIITPAEFLKRF